MSSTILQTDNGRSDNAHRSTRVAFIALRIVLGILFCVAGLSKLFILNAFSETVGQVFPALSSASTLIAVFVICTEIVCGAGVLLNISLRQCALVLGLLTTGFLYILAIAIISQHAFLCRCFGIIPVSLSNSAEFILNIIILDVLCLLFSLAAPAGSHNRSPKKWQVIAVGLIVLYAQSTTAAFILDRDMSGTPIRLQNVNNYLSSQIQYYQPDRLDRHIVLLRLSDFNCPPCFNDFVDYVQFTRQYYDAPRDTFRIVGLVEQSGAICDTAALQAWGAANNIQFPVFLVPDSIFQQFDFVKSCVVHQRPYGKLRFVYTFPGDESGRKKLLSAFTE
jgi:uncharacterized membrane protein YphA (DoxX/SURF4 family)